MKKKITRILGVALTLSLLSSLVLSAAPVSAGTLSWGAETTYAVPTETGKVLMYTDDVDIKDMAVGMDGSVVYVVTGSSFTTATQNMFKSTNGGETWSQLTVTGVATGITSVAVAPDDDKMVAVIADSTDVYISTDGGTTWSPLPTTEQTTYGTAANLYDIAIAPLKDSTHYLAVAGDEGAAVSLGNVWYFNVGAAAPVWKETQQKDGAASGIGTTSDDRFVAVAFSPNFASDQVMLAVGGPSGAGVGGDTEVELQIFHFASRTWNTTAGFANYPADVDSVAANTDAVVSADIALPTTYLGSDDVERNCFVAVNTDDTTNKGSLNRLKDTTLKVLQDTAYVHSVSYNTDTDKLVAGLYDSNNVYRSDDPFATTPTVSSASTYKRPGANGTTNHVVVSWAGEQVYAVTDSDESAFSISNDDGKSFNDISLIDTTLTDIRDMEVSADGSTVYFISDDGTNVSVWSKSSIWERILCITDDEFQMRLAPDDTDSVYVFATDGSTNTQQVYYSNDAGETKWWLRTCGVVPEDLAVESADVVYAISDAGSVSKSTNSGFIWASAKATGLTPAATANARDATLVSVGADLLIATDDQGYVAYSTEGNASATGWTKITSQVNTSTSLVQVAAEGLADGDYIYAASAGTGLDIRRWEIGTSTSWSDIISGTITTAATDSPASTAMGVYGLALQDGALYALASNGTDSGIWRTLSPATASSTTTWSYKLTTDANDEGLDSTPRALKVSKSDSTIKLWAIENDLDKIYSFSDTIALTGPSLLGPADNKKVDVNPTTGRAYDISFSWSRLSECTAYDVEIALDSDMNEKVVNENHPSTSSTVAYVVGPFGADKTFEFLPNTTYYWRIRSDAAGPLYSPYSAVRTFSVGPAVELLPSPTMQSPAPSATGVGLRPTFSWSTVPAATAYELELADNPFYANAKAKKPLSHTVWQWDLDLEYDTTYYWRVRAVTATEEGAWSEAIFMTMAEPAPPEKELYYSPLSGLPFESIEDLQKHHEAILQQLQPVPPAAPVMPTPVIPDYLLWTIIGIGAVLVIVVIVLIVRTRRVA
jgi:hypothetical protein